jgi:hypothetical protein
LKECENRALREIFRLEEEQITGRQRQLYKEELHHQTLIAVPKA